MIMIDNLPELAAWRKAQQGTVALVPTMGALHEGHRSLLRIARKEADLVVASIFVNPLQFGPGEDFTRYPRTFEVDLEACVAEGVDVVFAPAADDLYAPGRQVSVSAGAMGTILEGASRPGHFDGVLTVVLKLFHLVGPDIAVFGQKDAQQLAVIRRMVADLDLGIQILAAPIVRDPDGLALSSRNRYLSLSERESALALSRSLRAGAEYDDGPDVLAAAGKILAEASADPAFVLDYLRLVQPDSLADVASDGTGDALLLVAAKVGSTRLIDNRVLYVS